jgi:Spy/CpxP family protein refolding chaperone
LFLLQSIDLEIAVRKKATDSKIMSLRHLRFIAVIFVVALSCILVFTNYMHNWQLHNLRDSSRFGLNYERNSQQPFPAISLTQQLHLTPQQREQIGKIRHKYKQPLTELHKNFNSGQQELAQMMAGIESIPNIRNKHQQITKLQQEMGELHLTSMLEIRQILTLKQRQQFAQIMKSHREMSQK